MVSVSSRVLLAVALGPALTVAQSYEVTQFHPGRRARFGLEFDTVRNEVIAFGAGTLATTMWGWNGSRWRTFEPSTAGPTTRNDVRTTSDPSTGRVFAYGGGSFSTELWQWDGATWTLLSNVGPSPRLGAGLAFDPASQALYLFGGRTPINDVSSELWRYQGGVWSLLSSSGPTARFGHAMVWDPTAGGGSGGVFLFGGNTDGTGLGWNYDTWRWTGAGGWTLAAIGAPVLGLDYAMCRDDARNCIVLTGFPGLTSGVMQTWEWSGAAWLQRVSPHVPDSRQQARLAFDPLRQRSVLYGGSSFPSGTARYDTWEWDGTDWNHVGSEFGGSSGVATAFDEARGTQVYFASRFQTTLTTSTWESTGGALVKRSVTGPPHRIDACMWYDPAASRTLMFGGRDLNTSGPASWLNDLWSFDGTSWTQVPTAVTPPGRGAAACAYDPVRQRAVLFGGLTQGLSFQDTWEWSGSSWTLMNPVNKPSARFYPALGFDPVTQRVILFGGNAPGAVGDTWAWNGVNWQQLNPATAPGAHRASAMIVDRDRSRLVMFGGPAGTACGVWEWTGADWLPHGTLPLQADYWAAAYDRTRGRAAAVNFDGWRFEMAWPRVSVGLGNPNNDPSLACATRPAVGGSLDLAVTSTVGGPMFAAFSLAPPMLPIPLGGFCSPTSFYLPALDVLLPITAGTLSIPMPPGAGYDFLGLGVQVVELRPSCLELSNALAIRVQPD